MSVLVNLYRNNASKVFTEMRFVSFHPIDKDGLCSIAMHNYNWAQWQTERTRFARELKQFMREVGISYGWPNGSAVDYANFVRVAIINPADYGYITLMSDEYEITTSYMMPSVTPSYMFQLTPDDYEKYKDIIAEVKCINR